MSKSKFLNNIVNQKTNIALVCILGMIVGFLVSRAVASLSIMVFGVNALWNIHPREWFRHKWWLLGCGWIAAYAISWFWSEDKGYWNSSLQVKMPILLLPLSFALLPRFSVKQLRIFMVVVALLLLGGACYSISFLINDPEYYITAYGRSTTLPTPAKNDHIRFSMCVVLFVIWCIYFWRHVYGWLRWLLAISVLLLIVYLHVLAAKSGLITLYAFFVLYSMHIALNRQKILGIGIIAGTMLLVVFAIRNVPTLNSRLHYIRYSIDMYKNGDRSGNYGDVSRLISYELAFKLIEQHPWTGVGMGDIFQEMKILYQENYPQIKEDRQILPHNQMLMVAAGCGVPAGLLFLVWVFAPLTWLREQKGRVFLIAGWFGIFLQLMIEPVLEVQYGVFVYLFFLLWYRYTLDVKKAVQE